MAIRKRIGALVPSTNTTAEGDYQLAAPAGVTIHGMRMWLTNEGLGTGESMDSMNAEIASGATYLSTANVDAIAYLCTTGSFYKGAGWDKEMCDIIEQNSGVPGIATSPSAVEALKEMGAKKVSIATPYPEWNNGKLREYFTAAGFEVLNVDGDPIVAKSGNQGINDQDPERIVEFASSVCHPDADVLFCSCTAWRSMEAADRLEQEVGKPVVTSNQATVWKTFKTLGLKVRTRGFGQLLDQLA